MHGESLDWQSMIALLSSNTGMNSAEAGRRIDVTKLTRADISFTIATSAEVQW